jgi:predicted PurR-regulated permease PerM
MQSQGRDRRCDPQHSGNGSRYSLLEAPPNPADPTGISRPSVRVLRALEGPLWVLALCAVLAMLRVGRDALVPVALAVLIALMLSGVVEGLRGIRVPRGLSALVLLMIIAVAVAGVVDMIRTPAQQWIQSAPRVMRTIEQKVRPAQSLVRRIDALAKRASALASPDGNPAVTPVANPSASVTTVEVLAGTGWLLGATLAVMALTLLLLAAGPRTLARMTAALSGDLHAAHALRIIDAIRLEVGRYYGTLALINLGFGTLTAISMSLLGMPNPILWGAVAGVLNFIPYLGPATTLAVLTLVALVTFDSTTHVLMVATSYLALAAVEGHIVEPVFLGRRLDLNPIVVFVALWIGGWLWGVPGVVVALPVLVATKVAASHSRRGEMLVRFLSPGGGRDLLEARRPKARRVIGDHRGAGARPQQAEPHTDHTGRATADDHAAIT